MNNFDQWAEQLSKQVLVRSEEEEMKIFWKIDETFVDDFEEEE